MRVVAINGSPRSEGNTAILIDTVLEVLRTRRIETETIHLAAEPVRGCTACFQCYKRKNGRCVIDDDPVNRCIEAMTKADGIVLGSPTYFSDVTAEMKALIDRAGYVGLANGGLFRRKVGAAVSAVRRAGSIHVLDSINHLFMISGMVVPGSTYWNLGMGAKAGEVAEDGEGIRTMKALGENMAWLLELIANHR